MIENPSLVQASGFGFAPKVMPQVVDKREVPNYLGAFSAFTEKIVKPLQEDAFLEGVTDNIAGQIEERSWLTQESYMQGVAYSNWNNKLSDLTPQMQALAKESARKGETVQQFNTRLQPLIADANAELDRVGLTGKARELAQRALIEQPTKQLMAYQKEREEETKFRLQKGMWEASANVTTSMLSGDLMEESSTYERLVIENGSTAEAQLKVSKTIGESILTGLNTLNMSKPDHRQRMNLIQTWIQREDVRQRYDPDTLGKIQSTLSTKYEKASDAMKADLTEELRSVELNSAAGGKATLNGYQAFRAKTQGMVTNGVLSATDAAALEDRYHNQLEAAVKLQAQESDARNARQADRTLRPELTQQQIKIHITEGISKYGNTAQAYLYAADQLASFGSAEGINAVGKLFASELSTIYNQDVSKLDETSMDGTHQDMQQGFLKAIRQYNTANPVFANELLKGIQDDNLREAIRYVAENPETGQSTIRTAQEIMRKRDQYIRAADSGVTTGLSEDEVRFTASNMKQGWAKGMFFTKDAHQTDYYYDASEQVRLDIASKLNALVKQNKSRMIGAGLAHITAAQQSAALVKLGLVVPTRNGPALFTKSFKDGIAIDVQGKRMQVDNTRLASALNTIGDDVAKITAGGRYDRNNVTMTVDGNFLHVSQLDDEGNEVARKRFSVDEVSAVVQQQYNEQTKAAKEKHFTTVVSNGASMRLTETAAKPFGSAVVAKEILQHLNLTEGQVVGVRDTRPEAQKAKSKMPNVPSTGIGVSLLHHPEWAEKFKAAGNDPDAKGKVQSEFFNKYFTKDFNFKAAVKAMGMPDPSSAAAVDYIPVYKALADMAYYRPAAGQVMQRALINAYNGKVDAAFTALKKLPEYNDKNKLRKKAVDEAINLMSLYGDRARFAKSLG